MKRFFCSAALVILPLTGVIALPVSNPSYAQFIEEGFFSSPAAWMSLRVGYEGNFVRDQRLEQKISKRDIDLWQMDMQSGVVTINIKNRWDLYGLAGEARYKGNWNISNLGLLDHIEMESQYGLGWAVGSRIALFEWCNTSLEVGGRYFEAKNVDLAWITSDAMAFDGAPKISEKSWQIDVALSHKINFLIPYIAGKYAREKISLLPSPDLAIADDDTHSLKMVPRNKFGLALGCGVTTGKMFFLNVEARLIDEEAVTVSGEIRF